MPLLAAVPLLLAASGPKMLRLAGSAANGVLLSAGASPEFIAWSLEQVGRRHKSLEPGVPQGLGEPKCPPGYRRYPADPRAPGEPWGALGITGGLGGFKLLKKQYLLRLKLRVFAARGTKTL